MLFGIEGLRVGDAEAGPGGTVTLWAGGTNDTVNPQSTCLTEPQSTARTQVTGLPGVSWTGE